MIVGVIQNGGLETGDFTGWVIDGHVNDPVVTNTLSHTGTYSALAGLNPQQETFCAENNNEPLGDSSFYQQFTVPAGGGTLSFWYWTCTFDFLPRDWRDAYVTDSNGAILKRSSISAVTMRPGYSRRWTWGRMQDRRYASSS